MNEVWKLCAVNPLYFVSDQGRVRRIGGHILKPQRHIKGYLYVHLGRGMRHQFIHRLVAATFLGVRNGAWHVDHLNFDRTDNRVENLRWLISAENSVRWGGRRSDKSIVWLHRSEPDPGEIPESHELTSSEEAEITSALEANGW